jgi:hypothetical protein
MAPSFKNLFSSDKSQSSNELDAPPKDSIPDAPKESEKTVMWRVSKDRGSHEHKDSKATGTLRSL